MGTNGGAVDRRMQGPAERWYDGRMRQQCDKRRRAGDGSCREACGADAAREVTPRSVRTG